MAVAPSPSVDKPPAFQPKLWPKAANFASAETIATLVGLDERGATVDEEVGELGSGRRQYRGV